MHIEISRLEFDMLRAVSNEVIKTRKRDFCEEVTAEFVTASIRTRPLKTFFNTTKGDPSRGIEDQRFFTFNGVVVDSNGNYHRVKGPTTMARSDFKGGWVLIHREWVIDWEISRKD
jgi:hypothetical protein